MRARIIRVYDGYLIEAQMPSGDYVALNLRFDAEHEAIDEATSYGLDLQEFIDRSRQP